ncbi:MULTISPECIES: hypothetical protein [unclassified Streptomyces]|uniref:hypothetical protein n=1 Tax=unclassified Streptomyces TaxID=2593676 RepID=UPI00224C8446|nr:MULTISPECIES: hypothetical protein [unclassified Streptomyces]MCX5293785.1 hypothetical protein [Streptomyces sp. NBC_00183]
MEAEVAFGRNNKAKAAEEAPVEPVSWETVFRFAVGSVERPKSPKRLRSVWGKPAVRVPTGSKDYPVLAPCAFLGSSSVPNLPSRPELTLFEDVDARRLLCYVEEAREVDGEQHHAVRDAQGQLIGTLRRVPPKRPFKHTWRIDQPGQPEIVGRNEWASGSTGEVAARVAIRATFEAVDGLFSTGNDDGAKKKARSLEWRAGDNVVMTSEGSVQVKIEANWLDRRLAFAFALVGDK